MSFPLPLQGIGVAAFRVLERVLPICQPLGEVLTFALPHGLVHEPQNIPVVARLALGFAFALLR